MRALAWQSLESNQMGTDEFMTLCRQMDWEPMLAVNLGTGTPEEARNWVEYCNAPANSHYAQMRAANGHPEPYGVKLWCLGNEMDGPWQLGHVPADVYAIRAQQAGKMMRDTDRSIELVARGSSGPQMKTYAEWDRQVLEYLGDLADYISLHRYVGNHNNDTADFLAITNAIDKQIEEVDAICRQVQAVRRSEKRAYLCFDEWNVWYKNMEMDGEGKFAPHLIEEVYHLEDALVVAGFFNSFVRHADVVKIANIAQIVNIIAPIQTRGDEMLIQSIFYPFMMMSQRREGVALQTAVSGPTYDSPSYGTVHTIDTSAILGDGELNVFVTNRGVGETAVVHIDLADKLITGLKNGEILTGPDAKTANSYEQPNLLEAQPFSNVTVVDGKASIALPPLSFAALTFAVE